VAFGKQYLQSVSDVINKNYQILFMSKLQQAKGWRIFESQAQFAASRHLRRD